MSRTAWLAGGVALAASVAMEIAFHDPGHSLSWWHEVPGFDFVFGLAGAAALVLAAKAAGSIGLRRPETYYDEDERA